MSCADKSLHVLQRTPVTPPPLVPKPVFRTEVDPYPMTFVQADRAAFKQVVQLLTGSPETSVQASDSIAAASLPGRSLKGGGVHPRRQGSSKLYERRNSHPKKSLVLNTVARQAAYSNQGGGGFPEALSPSMLDFPLLALSPVTPLNEDLFNKSSPCLEEEKAIAEKRFYMHPSLRTIPRNAEPKLLQLFPSPRD